MKKLVLLFVFFGLNVTAQEDAWVYLADKPDTEFYLNNPLEMLSQRALDRRVAQNIPLSPQDVPVYPSYIDQIESAAGIEVMAHSKWLNALHVRGSQAEVQALLNLSFVTAVDFADHSLNDSGRVLAGKLSSVSKSMDVQIDFPYGNSANQIEMLSGHLLHQQNYTGAGKIVAVLDAGFPGVNTLDPFARLRDNNLILGGYNFPDQDENIYSRSNHGTLVLSTMGGYVENQLVGTAPDASYYLFITEDVNSENPVEESYWVEAAEMADSLGVDVINSSLGYFIYDNPAYSYSYADMDGNTGFASRGATIAVEKGMAVVVSAGNSGNSSNPNINVPSDAENILCVGAVNPSGQYVSFSSIGPSADNRVKPDVMAQGQQSVVANTSGNVVTGSGTSFASPILAGMVTSLWQAVPELTATQLMQAVRESAHLYDNPNPQYGYGIPNFQDALDAALTVASFDKAEGKVFPNPFSSGFSLTAESGNLTIFDALGRTVSSEFVVPGKVFGQGLQSGLYYYRWTDGRLVKSGKIIRK